MADRFTRRLSDRTGQVWSCADGDGEDWVFVVLRGPEPCDDGDYGHPAFNLATPSDTSPSFDLWYEDLSWDKRPAFKRLA